MKIFLLPHEIFFKKILFNIHKIIYEKTFPVQGTGLKLVLLYRVQKVMHINIIFSRPLNVMFTLISFVIQKDLVVQFIVRLSSTHM